MPRWGLVSSEAEEDDVGARILFAVFIGVLAGGSAAYRLFNTFWHFGVLAGIAAGVAVAWVALSPVEFWRGLILQLAKLDDSFRRWQEKKREKQARINEMRETWIQNEPGVLQILLLSRVLNFVTESRFEYSSFQSPAAVVFFTTLYLRRTASVPLIVTTITFILLVTAVVILVGFLTSSPYPRSQKGLIPGHWSLWDAEQSVTFKSVNREALDLLARGASGRELLKKFWLRLPVEAFFGWAINLVWPGLKWLWPKGPIVLRAIAATFRYTHSDAHRHVATHTALGIAVGVWGFNAPVLPLALIAATVSVAVWHTVSKRVFRAA